MIRPGIPDQGVKNVLPNSVRYRFLFILSAIDIMSREANTT
jgi:hypothetical protein